MIKPVKCKCGSLPAIDWGGGAVEFSVFGCVYRASIECTNGNCYRCIDVDYSDDDSGKVTESLIQAWNNIFGGDE